MQIIQQIWEGILNTTWIEGMGVFTGIAYVILAAKKHISCWFFAILSTSIYIYLCFANKLFIESGLQLFYLIMGVYGWIQWKRDSKNDLPIQRWPVKYHMINIVISTFIMLCLGFLMQKYTDQQSPYLDAFTTVFSLAATFMVTQRVLGNWLYWVIIDFAAAILYSSRGLYLTGVQYTIFAIIAGFAFYSWYIYFLKQKKSLP